MTDTADILREIRQRIYALRNGVISDIYRRAGDPHEIVMGLQLPQISEIARDLLSRGDIDHSALILELWGDCKLRESRLLACYLSSPGEISRDMALKMASECITQEEADVLCMKLLRRFPDTGSIMEALEASPAEGSARCLTALRR